MPTTVTINLQFKTDAQRDAALLDYCRVLELDIYSDTVRDPVTGEITSKGTIIDPTKVLPAVRGEMARQMRETVVSYRASIAARDAARTKRTQETADLEL
jgi:hypothetical protein